MEFGSKPGESFLDLTHVIGMAQYVGLDAHHGLPHHTVAVDSKPMTIDAKHAFKGLGVLELLFPSRVRLSFRRPALFRTPDLSARALRRRRRRNILPQSADLVKRRMTRFIINLLGYAHIHVSCMPCDYRGDHFFPGGIDIDPAQPVAMNGQILGQRRLLELQGDGVCPEYDYQQARRDAAD